MGGYERHSAPWALDEHLRRPDPGRLQRPAARGGLAALRGDRAQLARGGCRRWTRVKVTRLINGPEAFTPDNEFCLGESEVRRLLRRRRVLRPRARRRRRDGQADGRVDPRRRAARSTCGRWTSAASARTTARPRYTLARAREVYETYYDIRYPGHERQAGRPLRVSSAYEWHRAHGAAFGEKSGWERVNWYESNAAGGRRVAAPARLGRACTGRRRSAPSTAPRARRPALFDESSFAKLEVARPGRRGAARAAVRQPRRARRRRDHLHADAQPPRRDRVRLHRHAAGRGRCSGSSPAPRSATTTWRWIRRHLPDDGSVRVDDVTSRWACFALWGPRARDDPRAADARPARLRLHADARDRGRRRARSARCG